MPNYKVIPKVNTMNVIKREIINNLKNVTLAKIVWFKIKLYFTKVKNWAFVFQHNFVYSLQRQERSFI